MKNKINNSFNEEYKDIKTFIHSTKQKLKRKRKIALYIWTSISLLIALTNIAILVVSFVALKKVIWNYNLNPGKYDWDSQVLPTAMVSIVSIMLLIVSVIIAIYQGYMKSTIYKDGMQAMQYEYVRYTENKESEEELKKKINSIYKSALCAKTNGSFKRAIINILTGGTDE